MQARWRSPTLSPAGQTRLSHLPLATMKKINADQFERWVERDPAWAFKLSEPVEISDFCYLCSSPITHLSPFLHFTGTDIQGTAAVFQSCRSLRVAEGTFHGFVDFHNSGIERIGDITVTQPRYEGYAASFTECKALTVAEGTFPGHVDFNNSGIERIGDLVITQTNTDGEAVCFCNCKNLRVAEGIFTKIPGLVGTDIAKIQTLGFLDPDSKKSGASLTLCEALSLAKGIFPGHADFSRSGIERIGNLFITQPDPLGKKAAFYACSKLNDPPAWLLGDDYEIDDEMQAKVWRGIFKRAVRKSLSEMPTIEI